jgi:hypothetical protein
MKITPEIKRAIQETIDSDYNSSQQELAYKLGLHPSGIGRWLKGTTKKIEDDSWAKLYPEIRAHLKEEPLREEDLPPYIPVSVFSLSGEKLGATPLFGGFPAEIGLLVEEDLFLGPEISANAIAFFGPAVAAKELKRGEIVCSGEPPYQLGRWQVAQFQKESKLFRRWLAGQNFAAGVDPRATLRRLEKELKK